MFLIEVILTHGQKSKEKNVHMEESRRRNEASMARKRANGKAINPAAANAGVSSPEGPLSPTSSGAMDSLLEKLRAFAPQAKDQRDRRRRARLKDRHQVRVASGQPIPDIPGKRSEDSEDQEDDKNLLSPESAASGDLQGDRKAELAAISEGEDVAERAASLLQGLRGDGDTADGRPGSKDGSLRVRRRRESANDERRTRRRRTGASAGSGGSEDRDNAMSPTEPDPIPEEPPDHGRRLVTQDPEATTLTTFVSPPSPEGTEKKPVEISD